jgi:hypothetical protein
MSPAGTASHRGTARDVALGAGLVLSVVLIAGLFLRSPIERKLVVPPGPDTSVHLWRARVAAASDLRSLFDAAPFDFQVNPDRVGLPVLASVLSAVGVPPWRLMFVTPALAACLLAAAAWAFARAAGEPRWASPIYAIMVSVSVPFALTTRSRLDNALSDGLIVGAAAALVWLADGRGAGRLATVLLAGGLLMHWAVGGLFVAVGLVFALLLLPESLRRRRRGDTWSSTPSVRVSAALGAGSLVGAGPLLLTPGANLPHRGTGRHFRANVVHLLPRYRVPAIAAAGGSIAAVVRSLRDGGPFRHVTLLLGAWLLPAVAASILYVAGIDLPLMRFLGATMALPLLAAVLLSSLVTWASDVRGRLRAPAVAIGSAAVAGTLIVSALAAGDVIDGSGPSITEDELPLVQAAVAYAVRVRAPEVVIVVSHRPGRAFRRVRMLAPPWLIPRVGVFEGEPRTLFERAEAPPDQVPPGLEGVELKNASISADGVTRMRVEGAIALSLEPFMKRFRRLATDPSNREIADGVMLLGDGDPPASIVDGLAGDIRPLAPPTAGSLVRDTAAALVALLIIGLGWSAILVPARWDVRVALAPCIGMAGILVVGTVAGLGGLPLGGGFGLAMSVLIAAGGAFAAVGWHRRGRGDGDALDRTG